jgi:hypothetical protein
MGQGKLPGKMYLLSWSIREASMAGRHLTCILEPAWNRLKSEEMEIKDMPE